MKSGVFIFVVACTNYVVPLNTPSAQENLGQNPPTFKLAGGDNEDNEDTEKRFEETPQEHLLEEEYRKLSAVLNKFWAQRAALTNPPLYYGEDKIEDTRKDTNGGNTPQDNLWRVINARNEIPQGDLEYNKNSFRDIPSNRDNEKIRDYIEEQREFKKFVKELRDRLPNFKKYGPRIIPGTYWQQNFNEEQNRDKSLKNEDNEKYTSNLNNREVNDTNVNVGDKNTSGDSTSYEDSSEDSEDSDYYENSDESEENTKDIAKNSNLNVINLYNPTITLINIIEDPSSPITDEDTNYLNEDTDEDAYGQPQKETPNKVASSLQLSDTKADCWWFRKRGGGKWRRNRSRTTTTTTTTTTTEGTPQQNEDNGDNGGGNNEGDDNGGGDDNGDNTGGGDGNEDNNNGGPNEDNNEDTNGGGDNEDNAGN